MLSYCAPRILLMSRHCKLVQRKQVMDTNSTARKCGWYTLRRKLAYQTNAADASIFLIFANLDPSKGYKGITCFVAEKEWGVEIAKKEKKVSPRRGNLFTYSLAFEPPPLAYYTSTTCSSQRKISLDKRDKGTKSRLRPLMRVVSGSLLK